MKKKVLAKSTRAPKKLVTYLMNKEGGKSSMKIHQCREMLKDLAEVLCKPMNNNPLANELADYVCATHKRMYGVKVDYEFTLSYRSISDKDKATDKYFIERAKSKAAVKKSKALGERK